MALVAPVAQQVEQMPGMKIVSLCYYDMPGQAGGPANAALGSQQMGYCPLGSTIALLPLHQASGPISPGLQQIMIPSSGAMGMPVGPPGGLSPIPLQLPFQVHGMPPPPPLVRPALSQQLGPSVAYSNAPVVTTELKSVTSTTTAAAASAAAMQQAANKSEALQELQTLAPGSLDDYKPAQLVTTELDTISELINSEPLISLATGCSSNPTYVLGGSAAGAQSTLTLSASPPMPGGQQVQLYSPGSLQLAGYNAAGNMFNMPQGYSFILQDPNKPMSAQGAPKLVQAIPQQFLQTVTYLQQPDNTFVPVQMPGGQLLQIPAMSAQPSPYSQSGGQLEITVLGGAQGAQTEQLLAAVGQKGAVPVPGNSPFLFAPAGAQQQQMRATRLIATQQLEGGLTQLHEVDANGVPLIGHEGSQLYQMPGGAILVGAPPAGMQEQVLVTLPPQDTSQEANADVGEEGEIVDDGGEEEPPPQKIVLTSSTIRPAKRGRKPKSAIDDPNIPRIFNCATCKKPYTKISQLRAHERTHTGALTYTHTHTCTVQFYSTSTSNTKHIILL